MFIRDRLGCMLDTYLLPIVVYACYLLTNFWAVCLLLPYAELGCMLATYLLTIGLYACSLLTNYLAFCLLLPYVALGCMLATFLLTIGPYACYSLTSYLASLLSTSPIPLDLTTPRMPSAACQTFNPTTAT